MVRNFLILLPFAVFSYEQVTQVVRKTESLKRISFLAHSLGGLFARYAVAVLYSPNDASSSSELSESLAFLANANSKRASSSLNQGMIAGLEPINFITLASPHLGVRGKNQVRSHGYNFFVSFHHIR